MKNAIPFIVAVVAFAGFVLLLTAIEPSPQTSSTSTLIEVPVATGYVNDTSDVLSPSVEEAMERYLTEFAKSGKGEIAVFTLPTTGDETIEQFGIRLGDTWKVGDSEEDNGVILLVATEDRQVRIEVGKGAEAFITDSQAGQILDNQVVPSFKLGDWSLGINDGLIAIVAEMTKE